jgi:feruloyl esterase
MQMLATARLLTIAAALAFVLVDAPAASAASCESLASLKLTNVTVTSAESVAAGAFTPPAAGGGRGGGPQFKDVPAFCRVAATLTPTKESEIKVEVWLPATGWNGKFQAIGNGGWNGTIDRNGLAAGVRRGYAMAATDTGHEGGAGPWMLNQEKLADWAHRSVHEMAVAGKALVNGFYGSAPKLSYFAGCSAGGRQAMKLAQRYPTDFDGIIAGAPGLDWTSRAAQSLRLAQLYQRDEASKIPPAKYAAINAAVLRACDPLDGVTDGVLENPRACKFDPGVLQCKGADDASCLTAPQVETARAMYAATTNPKTKREITALERGSELGWTDQGWTGGARTNGMEHFRYVVFKDPQWDAARFNFESDIVRAEEVSHDINALDPNLKAFFDRGGKLIHYHGWNDPQISPGNSVQYHQRVVDTMGGASRVRANYRLFMVPGMGHCGGGTGTSTFDMVTALEQWVEQGKAPDAIPASRVAGGKTERTRPLCPYPQVATYKGTGSTDDAASFVCK